MRARLGWLRFERKNSGRHLQMKKMVGAGVGVGREV